MALYLRQCTYNTEAHSHNDCCTGRAISTS